MTSLTSRRAILLVISILCAPGAFAQGTNTGAEAAARVTATSSSGRFLVTAPDLSKASEYTRWAEEMAERFEHLTGAPAAFSRLAPLHIVLAAAGSPAEGLAIRSVPGDGRLNYILSVNEYVALDYEDLLAAYCRLATAAAMDRYRPGSAGGELQVPDWLAVGLAQNLDPLLRNRDRRLVGSWIPVSERPDITRVLTWDRLPETWYRTRALCGVAALWVVSLKPQGQGWPLIVERLASGQRLSPVWIGASLAGVKPGAGFAQAWADWLDRQGRMIQDLGAVSTALIDQLKRACDTPASELRGVRGLDPSDRLTPRQLIALRREPPVQLVAELRAQQVQALTIGRAPELAAVGERYALFFEGLSDGATYVTLRWRLGRAERAWGRLAALTREREAYVDAVEQESAPAGRTAGPAGLPEPLLEKSRIEAYLDDAERRFGRTGDEKADKPRREGSTGDEQRTETHAQNDGRTH